MKDNNSKQSAQQIGRLTNLMNLTVDTSCFTRYHSTTNPDLGATFAQALNLVNVPGIPRTNADYNLSNIQAIANIAAFPFGFIEQGGSSLYATLSQKVSSAGSPEDHAEYRRRRNMPLFGMGGLFGEFGAATPRTVGSGERPTGVEHVPRPHFSGLYQ